MGFEHATLVWLSKSFGLFYLIGLSLAVLAYALWPSNKAAFDRAADSIVGGEDKPWR